MMEGKTRGAYYALHIPTRNLAADGGNKGDLWDRCLSGTSVPLTSFFPLFCTFIPLELTHGRGTDVIRIENSIFSSLKLVLEWRMSAFPLNCTNQWHCNRAIVYRFFFFY